MKGKLKYVFIIILIIIAAIGISIAITSQLEIPEIVAETGKTYGPGDDDEPVDSTGPSENVSDGLDNKIEHIGSYRVVVEQKMRRRNVETSSSRRWRTI